jgi:hypothetical protein
MRIKDLPEPVKTWALNNQEKQSIPRDIEQDVNDFYWADTPEGTDFWADVHDGIISFNTLTKKHPTLDWGFQVEANIQTDNSKVNENLLKENEELKFKLKRLRDIIYSDVSKPIIIDVCQLYIGSDGIDSVQAVFDNMKLEFFEKESKDLAKELISGLDESVIIQLKKLLNQE